MPLDRPPIETAAGSLADQRTIRVLLVDDHPAIRLGLERLIGDQPDLELVAAATDANAALSDAARLPLDVAVVDYHLRGRDGLTLTRLLKRLPDPPRVLIYSAFADEALTVTAIVAGADGITSKGALGDELCNAIRVLARGRSVFPPVSRWLLDKMSAELEPSDEAVFRMLVHRLAPAVIADAVGVELFDIDGRRDTILRVLTSAPSVDRERRGVAALTPGVDRQPAAPAPLGARGQRRDRAAPAI